MIESDGPPTKILFLESDDSSFQIRQCVARALTGLPPVELYHARDATEALTLLETINPDVIVIDTEDPQEGDLLMESLCKDHPPVVMQTEVEENLRKQIEEPNEREITYLPKCDSLEGIHQTLLVVAAIGAKYIDSTQEETVH